MASISETYLRRIDALLASGSRRLLGLVGAPGAGKSTLAQQLAAAYSKQIAVLPMDGFHLANAELARLHCAHRKGACDTFDVAGYLSTLGRLRDNIPGQIVYAPEFRRDFDESIAGAIGIDNQATLVITEGNYLLLEQGLWAHVRPLLDEVWYVDVDNALRQSRLLQRHVHFGRTADEAQAWIADTDEPNARLIEATASRADLIFRWPDH